MKVTVIYGIEHKGSTYNITQLFLKKLKVETKDITEFKFFLWKQLINNLCTEAGKKL